jgi:hypothetical protein
MKSTERRRLKGNELSHALSEAGARFAQNRARVGGAVLAVALVLFGTLGYWAWRANRESRARVRLAEAITTMQSVVEEPKPGAKPGAVAGTYPSMQARSEAALAKLAETYNTYPSAEAGIAARYYAAATLAMLGRPAEALARYQEVQARAGATGFYGRMARLGIVEASAQAKQFDQAISMAQSLVNNTSDDSIPRDALLMELGRVYAMAGKNAEAKQTLDKVIAEFPDSVYVEEAKQLLSRVAAS